MMINLLGKLTGWRRYALVALAAGVVGWTANGWRLGSQISGLEAQHAAEIAAAAAAAQKRQAELVAQRDAEAARHAAIESDLYGKLRNAESENDRLRADVDAGNRRLRVRATCPAASSRVPEASPAAGVGDGAGAELDPTARPDYFALRSGIERVTRQLAACQARLK